MFYIKKQTVFYTWYFKTYLGEYFIDVQFSDS